MMRIRATWMQTIFPMNKTLVVLAGPTASGKTATGIRLAGHFNTEIISADSRQVYKETSIGTAVPSSDELGKIPHHFIQFRSLSEPYNASMFEQDVLVRLEALFRKHDLVFMVGGSGLYINAVCFGIDELPTIDPVIRGQLAEKFSIHGIESLQKELKKLDPDSYERIDLNNHYRLLKALEVTVQTGRPYSSFLTHQKRERDFHIVRLALDMEREVLYERINERVNRMVESGLVEEVKRVERFRGSAAMKTVGYREIFRYFDGEITRDEAIDQVKRNTRKYARKQLTWFRKDDLYPWFHPDQTEEMIRHIREKEKLNDASGEYPKA